MIFVSMNVSNKCVRSINNRSDPHTKDTMYYLTASFQDFGDFCGFKPNLSPFLP